MEKNRIRESNELKRRFVKDNNLPITVFDNPYFFQRLDIIDEFYDCKKKWELFCEEVSIFNSAEEYFAYYNGVKDATIEYLQNNEAFVKFSNDTFFTNIVNPYPKRNLYIEDNDCKSFISIDMNKANFTAMKRYDATIFDDADSWEEFMFKFTNLKHITQSKYIRQVILGACNPKKQIQLEQYWMLQLLNFIKNQVPGIEVFSLAVDEIILYHPCDGNNDEDGKRKLEAIRSALNRHVLGKMVKMEEFVLERAAIYGYTKSDVNDLDKVTFKCFDAETFHQHVKMYRGKEVVDDDLVFYHNGVLARFLEPIPNYWNPIASS